MPGEGGSHNPLYDSAHVSGTKPFNHSLTVSIPVVPLSAALLMTTTATFFISVREYTYQKNLDNGNTRMGFFVR